jgi:hypothetical protein
VTAVPLALITGSREQLGSAGEALGRNGFDVVTWEITNPLPLPDGPFDCYVQLPCGRTDPVTGRPPVADLVSRVDALAAVVGRLGPSASVLLGVEDSGPAGALEPGSLAPDLLAAVALALLEDLGRPAARVAVLAVADLCRPAGIGQWEIPTPPLVSAP